MISIIMPSYNSARWICETIESVQAQTCQEWELLITDDASTDDTVKIISAMQEEDKRIKLFVLEQNQGAARARNNSLEHANGQYIAYLDSDDLWQKDKLEKQLLYMQNHHFAMCYTDYDIVTESGEYRKTIVVPDSTSYEAFLRRPITCSHTVMFDMAQVDKKLLVMPDVRRGQDAATWLQVLKMGHIGYALHESMAMYRRSEGSLSSNKLKAIKRTWYLYRKIEHLSLPHACVCFVTYAFNALKKYC